ncbi:MAG: CBS domain-containing protein, partial [Deltaproteobacteria bacterium]
MNLNLFLISEKAPLREALKNIEANEHGIILTTDQAGAVIGLATDGDIRRKLIEGLTLDDAVGPCANPDFVWVADTTPREMLLKKLDHSIRVIPLLNALRHLTDIVS